MIDIPENMPSQRTLDWHRERLGKFNASKISNLIQKGKAGAEFGTSKAIPYIFEIAAERMLSKDIVEDDELLSEYLDLVNTTNKAMRFGTEQEPMARHLFEKIHGCKVIESPSIDHETIPYYSCSPDGLIPDENMGVEIKCPMPKTYIEYITKVTSNGTLLAVKPEYYWQIMAQIDICKLDGVYFVMYCPYLEEPIKYVKIIRDESSIAVIHDRVQKANDYIDKNIINKNKDKDGNNGND